MACGVVLGESWSGALADQVQYVSDGVGTADLLKNGSGSVTLFAFDEGQSLPESTAPFDAMVTVLEGQVEVTVEGEKHCVKAGEAVLIPSHRPHALSAPERVKIALTLLRAS